MAKDVIIACDFPGREETLDFLGQFREEKPFVKIGMELFYAAGPNIVRELKDRGHRVFLDLKVHDIPTTARKTMKVLAGLGADMVNLHAAGTRLMMEEALRGLEEGTEEMSAATGQTLKRPILIAVTQLTSTTEELMKQELLIREPLPEVVMSYARNAAAAGLDGVVCSPLEAGLVHQQCGSGFVTVTPGVRFADGEVQDQKRVMTPAQAAEIGSDYIVVGRPITKAEDPVAAYRRCLREFLG